MAYAIWVMYGTPRGSLGTCVLGISLPYLCTQVTGIGLSFSGQSRTPDANSCFKSVVDSLEQPLQMTHSFVGQPGSALPAASMLQVQGGTYLADNRSSPAVHTCLTLPHTDVNITLDFGFLLESFTNGLLMDDGNLRFPLPDLQANISVAAKPVLPDFSGKGRPPSLG